MRIQVGGFNPARRLPLGWWVGGLLALAACRESNPGAKQGETARPRKDVSLTLIGFNYTDLYIDSFSVNGQGGGNIYLSSPTSGGGGSVCCVDFSPASGLPFPVKIKWSRDRKRWCEKEVLITGPVPAEPRFLAVHFFPDGRIEAEITQQYPSVKLQLEERANPDERKPSGNTVADEQTARCKDGRF